LNQSQEGAKNALGVNPGEERKKGKKEKKKLEFGLGTSKKGH